jgi:hypothetical protein
MRLWTLLAILVLALGSAATFLGFQEPDVGAGYAKLKQDSARARVARAISQDIPVDAAYSAIPHQRTAFQIDRSNLPPDDAAYLADLFALTDAGLVERISIQQTMRAGVGQPTRRSNYDAILQAIMSLDTPAKLLPVEALVFDAISEQRRYLEQWRESRGSQFPDRGAGLVKSSHGKLIAAYNRLMKLYGNEDQHNKKAFYDHLCALDFI